MVIGIHEPSLLASHINPTEIISCGNCRALGYTIEDLPLPRKSENDWSLKRVETSEVAKKTQLFWNRLSGQNLFWFPLLRFWVCVHVSSCQRRAISLCRGFFPILILTRSRVSRLRNNDRDRSSQTSAFLSFYHRSISQLTSTVDALRPALLRAIATLQSEPDPSLGQCTIKEKEEYRSWA